MKAKNNKHISGRLSRLKQSMKSYSSTKDSNLDIDLEDADRALDAAKKCIDEIEDLIKSDPVFSNDGYVQGFPNIYRRMVDNLSTASDITSEEYVGKIHQDEIVFNQDFEDGTDYGRTIRDKIKARQ